MMSSPTMRVAPSTQTSNDFSSHDKKFKATPMGCVIPVFDEEFCTEQYLLDVLDHCFTLNGERHSLDDQIDWRTNPSRDIEWHILLHKFYYAPGLARRYAETGDKRYKDCFESLVRSWISQTPIGFIATDVTARRVQNWIYAWCLFESHDPNCLSEDLVDQMISSIEEQVDYVCTNLAAARNHRTLGLYAIFLASVVMPTACPIGYWREFSVTRMCANIEVDLLHDGVHCELSTDYHHIVLRSYLLFFRLARTNGVGLPPELARKVCLALDFSMYVHRPDGNFPALSDSDSGSFLQLLEWGAQLFDRDDYAFVSSGGTLGEPPDSQHKIFPAGGYAILRSPWRHGMHYKDARFMVFDCGEIGAGNHGHLDALNIEVAAYGKPLVVDPGRYTYDEQGDYNWRAHFRQTSAHNTVTINGQDQAIYRQSGSRRKIFGPHPVCSLVSSELSDDIAYLHGAVSGPNYAARHHRHIWFVDNNYWLILDRLIASEAHDYELRFQLAPSAQGKLDFFARETGIEVIAPGLTLFIVQPAPCLAQEAAFVSNRYGEKEAAPRICAKANAANYFFLSVLYPTRGSTPDVQCNVDGSSGASVWIDHAGFSDQWQWSADSNLMLRRSVEGVQSWRVPKAVRHGQ